MGEKKVTVTKQCTLCKEYKEVQLTVEEYEDYLAYINSRSILIQDALPNVAPQDRELLRFMGGVCSDCWNKYFRQPPDEDDVLDDEEKGGA